jgi:hypothetical protein
MLVIPVVVLCYLQLNKPESLGRLAVLGITKAQNDLLFLVPLWAVPYYSGLETPDWQCDDPDSGCVGGCPRRAFQVVPLATFRALASKAAASPAIHLWK